MFFLFTRKLYWKWKKFWCNSSLLEFVSKRLVSKRRPISLGGESEFPPLSGPRFLLTFFPFSDFAKHSTIWRPGTDQLWIHAFNTVPNIRDLTNFSMISLSQNLLLHNYLSHNFIYDFLCHRIYWWEVLRCGTDTECSKTKYFEIDPSFTAAPIAESCSFSNGFWAEKAVIKDQSPGPW